MGDLRRVFGYKYSDEVLSKIIEETDSNKDQMVLCEFYYDRYRSKILNR